MALKIVCVAPASTQFLWEAELLFHSIKVLDFPMQNVIWLSYREGKEAAERLSAKYGVQFHWWHDDRPSSHYRPSIRPYLWHKYLAEDPARQQETYLYVDSDVILNRVPDIGSLPLSETNWLASDVSAYARLNLLGYDGQLVEALKSTLKMSSAEVAPFLERMPGVQWLLCRPTAKFMWDFYQDCELVSQAFAAIYESANGNQSSWCTDIWVFPLTAFKHGIRCDSTPELDFSLTDDPIDKFDQLFLFHNSGVGTADAEEFAMFAKRLWPFTSPFGHVHVLDPAYCGYRYVEMMKEIDPATELVDLSVPGGRFGRLWDDQSDVTAADISPAADATDAVEGH